MLEAEHKMKLFFPVRPWENEPDRAEWVHDNGYKCRIRRNHITGTLCGYVGVSCKNKFYGVHYDNSALNFLNEVHGGLSYAEKGDDGWWWFGFDTAHAEDFCPKIVEHLIEVGAKDLLFYDCMNYRTWEFVDREVEFMANWLCSYGEITNVS
jgi:hypothetical protein